MVRSTGVFIRRGTSPKPLPRYTDSGIMSNDSHSSPAWHSDTHRGRTSLECAAQSTDWQRYHSRPPRCQSDSAAGESHSCVPGGRSTVHHHVVWSAVASRLHQAELLIGACRIRRNERLQKDDNLFQGGLPIVIIQMGNGFPRFGGC